MALKLRTVFQLHVMDSTNYDYSIAIDRELSTPCNGFSCRGGGGALGRRHRLSTPCNGFGRGKLVSRLACAGNFQLHVMDSSTGTFVTGISVDSFQLHVMDSHTALSYRQHLRILVFQLHVMDSRYC